MMPFERPGRVAAYTTITSIQSVPKQDSSCSPTNWNFDLSDSGHGSLRGQSPTTATDEQQAALQVLAGSSERADADRARAILLTGFELERRTRTLRQPVAFRVECSRPVPVSRAFARPPRGNEQSAPKMPRSGQHLRRRFLGHVADHTCGLTEQLTPRRLADQIAFEPVSVISIVSMHFDRDEFESDD
jgi:hypothetical protein